MFKFKINNIKIQTSGDQLCGFYAIRSLILGALGISFKDISGFSKYIKNDV